MARPVAAVRRAALTGLVVLTALMALGTALLGWAAVPLVAALFVALAPRIPALGRATPSFWDRSVPVSVLAAPAGALAWGALLAVDATGARFGAVLRMLAGVMQLPAAALVAATLLLPALLAWSAAALVEGTLHRAALPPAGWPTAGGGADPAAAPTERATPSTTGAGAPRPAGTQLESPVDSSAGGSPG